MKLTKIFLYIFFGLQIVTLVSCNKNELAALGIKNCSPLVPTQDFLNTAKLITSGNEYYFEVSPLKDYRENYKSVNEGCSVALLEVNVVKGRFKYIYNKDEQGITLLSTWTQIDKEGDYQLSISGLGGDQELSFCARSVSNLDEVSSWGCLPFLIDSAQEPPFLKESTDGGDVYQSSYCVNQSVDGLCTQYQNYSIGNFNSPYSFNGVSLNQVQMENPCILSSYGSIYSQYPGSWMQPSMQRQLVQTRVNLGTILSRGDIYVGVTSVGDVAAIIGDGTPSPMFVAYLCPRPLSGQGVLYSGVSISAYTSCAFKYITKANMVFPDGSQANFRALSPGGSSAGRGFSFCQDGGGSIENGTSCSGQAYWTTPGCAGYCQYNSTDNACDGSSGTSSGETSGTTETNCSTEPISPKCSSYCQVYPSAYGCLENGTNCNATPTASGCPGSSVTVNPNWGVQYPGGVPQGSCSDPYDPEGLTNAFDTRKGTITLAGLTSGSITYTPFAPDAPNLLNTSPMLKSVGQSKIFFMTDSVLKVRFKVKPQPAAAQSDTMCYGRNIPASTIPGYTKLQYYVKVYGASSSNALTHLGTEGPYTTAVNSCSNSIDLSFYKKQSPSGVVISIDQVKANQNCSPWTNGFNNCNSFKNVRSFDCWQMDFEVAADGTKIFD